MPNKPIRFSTNWNNKLLCEVFTTFRLENPTKYVVGQCYPVLLGKITLGTAELIKCTTYAYPLDRSKTYTVINGRKLSLLTENHALIDTGKSLAYLLRLFNNFYPHANWNTQPITWYFFKYTETTKERALLIANTKKMRFMQPDLFSVGY